MNRKLLTVTSLVAIQALAFSLSGYAEEKTLELVVTASRGTEQNPLDVPQSIKSISQEYFASGATIDLDDAIRLEPNVNLAPAGGNANYWQEGFSIRGLGGQRVLTLSDGIRQAGQGIGYGGGNLSLYDPFQIERLEIMKGAGSVLYGTDAIGGVINVITRTPKQREEFGTNGGLRFLYDGSRNMPRYGGYIDIGDASYGIVAGGSFSQADEPNLPGDNDANSGSFRQTSGWTKAEFYVDEDTTVRLIGDINRTNDISIANTVFPLPVAVFPPPGSTKLVFSGLQFDIPRYQRSLIGSDIEFRNVSDLFSSVKTGVYWQEIRRLFQRESPYFALGYPGFAGPPTFVNPAATVNSSQVNTDDTVNTIEWQTQATLAVSDVQSVTVGLDVGFDDASLKEQEIVSVVGVPGIGNIRPIVGAPIQRTRANANQVRIGAYAQDEIKSGLFTFIPGVRADYYKVQDDETDFDDDNLGLSGSLGTVAHVTETDSAYLNLAAGYRAPDLGERFQDAFVNLGVPSRVIGTADLDPERSYSAELGMKGDRGSFRYETGTFFNHVQDYIGLRGLGDINGVATEQYDNIGIVNLYGAEASVSYALTEAVELFTGAGRTWTNATEKVDVPNWIFNYGARYTTALEQSSGLKKFSGAIVARSVLDSIDNTNTGSSDQFPANESFTTLNLETTLELAKSSLGETKLVAGVRNIFNEKYREPFFAQLQPGINGYVGVQLEF